MILGSIATVAGTFFATFKGIKAVQTGINALSTAYTAIQKKGLALTIREKAVGFAKSAADVIGGAWKSLGTIPVIGAGLAAAAAIAGILFLNNKAKKKGDVSIDPRGGPIVTSPQEGTIFQGTKNDGVSMGPGEGLTARSRAGGGSMEETNKLLRAALSRPAPSVNLDSIEIGTVAGLSAFPIQ